MMLKMPSVSFWDGMLFPMFSYARVGYISGVRDRKMMVDQSKKFHFNPAFYYAELEISLI